MSDRPAITVWAQVGAEERRRVLTRNAAVERMSINSELAASIGRLLDDVRDRGDAALVDALCSYDSVQITPDRLRVTEAETAGARETIPTRLTSAIRFAIARSTAFNGQIVRRASWSVETETGVVGEVGRPVESVGLFVPSGKGSFPSVMVQIGSAAVAAAVPNIVVVVPPGPASAGVDPATLVAADELGLSEVYCLTKGCVSRSNHPWLVM